MKNLLERDIARNNLSISVTIHQII